MLRKASPTKGSLCAGCALEKEVLVPADGPSLPDIMIVGSSPLPYDADRGAPFTSSGGAMVKKIIHDITREMPRSQQPAIAYAYAVRCCAEVVGFKLPIDVLNQCRPYLMMEIERRQPRLIVTLGADAAKAMGYLGKMSDLRGHLHEKELSYGKAIVLPTYHPGTIWANPGLTPVLINDLKKAITWVSEGFSDETFDLETPTTLEGILKALDAAEKFIHESHRESGLPRAVAIDTETTSLNMWDRNQRMIAFSFAYKENHGVAFPWEHRECPFSKDDLKHIACRVEEVFGSDKVYNIMHNAKFDIKVLMHRYGLNIRIPEWDTMLVEHLVDEDKKGEYGLKTLTVDYFPHFGKYEAELNEHLSEIKAERLAAYKEMETNHRAVIEKEMLSYWLGMTPDKRLRQLSFWVKAGILEFEECEHLTELKFRKYKGEQVLLKKYKTAVVRMLSLLPNDALPIEITDLPDKKDFVRVTYEDVALPILLKYAAIDPVVTHKLVKLQVPKFKDDSVLIRRTSQSIGVPLTTKSLSWAKDNLTMPMARLLADMEYSGVRLDREKTKKYIRVVDKSIDQSLAFLYDEVGYRFNPAGNDLPKILYERMKLPVLKRSEKTNAPSTDADTLKELYDQYDLPILKQLLIYRKLERLRGTYLYSWLEKSSVDGKIHCSYNQNGTATYRLSSSGPNLQNVMFFVREVPLEFIKFEFPEATEDGLNVKELFIPDSEEYELYDLDISNAEIRVLCAYSRDEVLIGVFNANKCMHCLTASGISEYSYDEIKANKENKETPQYQARQIGKKVNFGTIYCISAQGLANQLWSELRIKRTVEESQGYLDGFFATYPGVLRYIDDTKQFVSRYNYTYTFTGRRRRFPIINYNRRIGSRVARQGVNTRIQTTSSDLLQFNMLDLDRYLLRPLGGRILLTVHDSVVFQLPKGAAGVRKICDQVIKEKTAARAPWLPVVWEYDVGKGPNYGHAYLPVL